MTSPLPQTSTLKIDWSWGSQKQVAFDPANGTIDFGWFQGNQFTITQGGGSVVIHIPSNNQSYTLTNVTLDQLKQTHIVANDASAQAAWNAAIATVPTPPKPEVVEGHTVTIEWHWGTMKTIEFDPAHDKIDLGWLQRGQFTLSEMDGMVMIEIPSNDQMYMLEGATLADLTAANFKANDAGALSYVTDIVACAEDGGTCCTEPDHHEHPENPEQPGHEHPEQPEHPGQPEHPEQPETNPYGGHDFKVVLTAPDIVGFDPAHDRLDLGINSVHAFIIVQTPDGVAFRTPWNSTDIQVIKGVSLDELTVNNFKAIDNQHLREDVSGALAWAHGIEQKPHTVYALSDQAGRVDRVAFDPATDKVDFRYFATRELVHMYDTSDGVVITNNATNQQLILQGAKVSQLTGDNFLFHMSQVKEDHLDTQLGIRFVEKNVLSRSDIPTAGALDTHAVAPADDGLPPVFHLMRVDDTVTGGPGAHLFDFTDAFIGRDVITDFNGYDGDALQFSRTVFATAGDARAHATQVGTDVVIVIDADESVTLKNLALSDLHTSAIHIV